MAFFKSRKGGDDTPARSAGSAQAARAPESIEAMRRRAKHRLIGASVLVLIGVVGFPLLFDTQPRPIAVDIPIEIPDRNKVKPPVPAPAPAVTAPARVAQAPAPAPAVQASTIASAPAPAPAKEEVAKAEPKPAPRTEPKPESTPPAVSNDGSRAQALLEGKTPAAAEGRYVVQVGAFSDKAKVREVRTKVEHAGLKTFTQEVDTKDGKRIRVRVGPFTNKSEADKAAEKVKGLDLQANVLSL